MHARVVGNFSKSLTAWAELRDSNDKARAIEVRWQGSQYSVVSQYLVGR